MELRNSFLYMSTEFEMGQPPKDLPLNGPLHSAVCDHEGRNKIEDLVFRTTNDVPESLVDEGGHGSLSIGTKSVGNDALTRSTASLVGVTP